MLHQQPCEASRRTLIVAIARESGWLMEFGYCFEGLKNIKTSDSAAFEYNSVSRFRGACIGVNE